MTLPIVTCVCPTYGRYPALGHLLEEAVESFLRQDYPADRRRLVILNDCPGQELWTDAPGVDVFNFRVRASSLGRKFNAGVVLVDEDSLVCPWEDDDVSLPHRLSLSVERLGDADYFNPRAYWYWRTFDGLVQHERGTGYAHNASLFRRTAWERVGGYPDDCRQDAGLDRRLRDPRFGLRVVDGSLTAAESFYVYRWGESDHHVSAATDPEAGWRAYGDRPVAPGRFTIVPHWRLDYAERFRDLGRR